MLLPRAESPNVCFTSPDFSNALLPSFANTRPTYDQLRALAAPPLVTVTYIKRVSSNQMRDKSITFLSVTSSSVFEFSFEHFAIGRNGFTVGAPRSASISQPAAKYISEPRPEPPRRK